MYHKQYIRLNVMKFIITLSRKGPWATSLSWVKQFKSRNTYHYIITLIKRKKPSFTLWELNGSSFEKTWISFIQGCIVPSLVEIGPMVLEKRFFNFLNVSLLFCNYLPLEKGESLHLKKLETPSPKGALCQVWLKLAKWFWRIRFLIS